MKYINKCYVLTADEAAIAKDSLVITLDGYSKVLNSASLKEDLKREQSEPTIGTKRGFTRENALALVKRFIAVGKLLADIKKEGWPKGGVYPIPYGDDGSLEFMANCDAEILLDAFLKETPKKEGE